MGGGEWEGQDSRRKVGNMSTVIGETVGVCVCVCVCVCVSHVPSYTNQVHCFRREKEKAVKMCLFETELIIVSSFGEKEESKERNFFDIPITPL